MQNPEEDIKKVLKLLITPVSRGIQQGVVNKYFVEEAAFRSPLFSVCSGPLSREKVADVYRWQRIMSPKNEVEVTKVVFDQSDTLYVELKQSSHIPFSPFKLTPSDSLICFKLKEDNGHYMITSQEDFSYHYEDLLKRVTPHFVVPLRIALYATSYASVLCAKTAQVLGFWRVVIEGGGSIDQLKPPTSNGFGPQGSEDSNDGGDDGLEGNGWQASTNGKHK